MKFVFPEYKYLNINNPQSAIQILQQTAFGNVMPFSANHIRLDISCESSARLPPEESYEILVLLGFLKRGKI